MRPICVYCIVCNERIDSSMRYVIDAFSLDAKMLSLFVTFSSECYIWDYMAHVIDIDIKIIN